MPEVKLANISKHYDDVIAVESVNLTVHNGEYVALLGPSGCGKTTTLRIIAGLTVPTGGPTGGEVFIDGKEVTYTPPGNRDIGFVFQHFEIFPFWDVWENVGYGPKLRGLDEIELEKRVWEALETTKLTDKVDNFPNELNTPELQRVGVARALATGAELMLFDEAMGALDPKIKAIFQALGALDPKVKAIFQHELRKIVKKNKLTAIHVTHDQLEAMAIADRIIVMRKGRILQIGKPTELYYKPNDIFVANFVGESNFMEGVVTNVTETGSEIRLRDGSILRTDETTIKRGKRVVVSIRQELLKIYSIERLGALNFIPGKIIGYRFLGDRHYYTLKLDAGEIIGVKEFARAPPPFKMEDIVTVRMDTSLAVVFEYPSDGLAPHLSLE
jgi:ABC-type Fe3+/spermidine/putrescine transport system ATPase subunit